MTPLGGCRDPLPARDFFLVYEISASRLNFGVKGRLAHIGRFLMKPATCNAVEKNENRRLSRPGKIRTCIDNSPIWASV